MRIDSFVYDTPVGDSPVDVVWYMSKMSNSFNGDDQALIVVKQSRRQGCDKGHAYMNRHLIIGFYNFVDCQLVNLFVGMKILANKE